jgi:hypothetical protein
MASLIASSSSTPSDRWGELVQRALLPSLLREVGKVIDEVIGVFMILLSQDLVACLVLLHHLPFRPGRGTIAELVVAEETQLTVWIPLEVAERVPHRQVDDVFRVIDEIGMQHTPCRSRLCHETGGLVGEELAVWEVDDIPLHVDSDAEARLLHYLRRQ